MSRCRASAGGLLQCLAILFVLGSAVRAQVPPVPVPPENPITPAKAVLGKILFWDEQLSSDNSVACGTCHIPESGGADPRSVLDEAVHPGPDGILQSPDDIRGSMGLVACTASGAMFDDGVFFPKRQVTGRKAPAFIGAQWSPEIFWDGRARSTFLDPATGLPAIASGGALENQSLGPPLSGVEMAFLSRDLGDILAKLPNVKPLGLASNLPPDVAATLALIPTYPQLFALAFGTPEITARRIAFAIATYERTLVPDQTPWDAWQAGNTAALTPDQVDGLNLFMSPSVNCNQCHVPPLFTDHTFRNIGLRPVAEDIGRQAVTQDVADRGKFKVPTLRNSGLRMPVFHNGSGDSMTEVLSFYDAGGNFSENLDPLIVPLNLSQVDRAKIADFVANALTDPRVALGLPPFDRPTLRSEFPANPVFYGLSTAGTGGSAPAFVTFAPSNLGNAFYTFGVAGGIGGNPALLGLSAASGSSIVSGARVNIAMDPSMVVTPTVLSGPGGVPGEGFASFTFSIPALPQFDGSVAFAQWFLLDPGAPGGISATTGARITVFAAQ